MDISLEVKADKYGKSAVTLSNGKPLYTDLVKLGDARQREAFIEGAIAKHPGLESAREHIDDLMMQEHARAIACDAPQVARPEPTPADLLAETPGDIRAEAEGLLDDPDLMRRIGEDAEAMGVAGERSLAQAIYVIGTSRLLDRPLAAIIQGASSTGKSYVAAKVADLMPPEGIIRATALTPNALYHMPEGALRHRFILAGERSRKMDDDIAESTRALREMLSAGRLSKAMPVKIDGRIETQTIDQPGPIAFIESTTRATMFDEDRNRCLLLSPDETSGQTRAIITALASVSAGSGSEAERGRIVNRHHAAQRMLEPCPVAIPFAERLGAAFPDDRVEARRAFPMLVSGIEAVALLHQRQRETDAGGRIVAEAVDYEIARTLFANAIGRALGVEMSEPAARALRLATPKLLGAFSVGDLHAMGLGVGRSALHGYVAEWRDAGAVETVEEGKGSSPALYRFTGATIAEAFILPDVEALCGALSALVA